MSSINSKLFGILSGIKRSGNFFTSGRIGFFPPLLEVEGVGPVALPLLPLQIKQLIAVAEQAPYGRGEQTLVDTTVRRTWQINANRVHIHGRRWDETLKTLVKQAADGLGVSGRVTAELYKLLVYDKGSFFVSHRDTEKVDGMFATLVITLPSLYSGGELLVRHQDQQERVDLTCTEPSDAAFAAFYADCPHEVLPVTSGCRLTLIYNLLFHGRKRLPEPPGYADEAVKMAAMLRKWVEGKKADDDASPEKLVYPLEHAYTEAGIAFSALKGADVTRAAVLIAAARQADCDLHLALLTIEESGSAEHSESYGSYRSRRRWHEDDEDDAFEVDEVYERSTTLSEWRCPDGSHSELGKIPFLEEELCPPDAFKGMDPDEEEFSEATGNEGASFERSYRRAALVVWSQDRRLAVLCQAGLAATLPYLGALTDRWIKSSEDSRLTVWNQAHELAGHMLAGWSRKVRSFWQESEEKSDEAIMLSHLARLKDRAHVETFLTDITARGVYGKADNKTILKTLSLLQPQKAAELIAGIIAENATAHLNGCGDLLARVVTKVRDMEMADLKPAATALLKALPGDPNRVVQSNAWGRPTQIKSDLIVDLITALWQIDITLANKAADTILTWPKIYNRDTLLVPALLVLCKQPKIGNLAAFQRIKTTCRNHLQKRIAEPLEPPSDWSRASTLSCHCAHCSRLAHFLADADTKRWAFKAAQAKRSHVESTIRGNACDLDLTTECSGRPYALVCTKNQTSYEKRAAQRKSDLANLSELDP